MTDLMTVSSHCTTSHCVSCSCYCLRFAAERVIERNNDAGVSTTSRRSGISWTPQLAADARVCWRRSQTLSVSRSVWLTGGDDDARKLTGGSKQTW